MRNRVQCKICFDVIESKTVHDFVVCKGGHIFTDGGQEYQRCGTLKEATFEDIIRLEDGE